MHIVSPTFNAISRCHSYPTSNAIENVTEIQRKIQKFMGGTSGVLYGIWPLSLLVLFSTQ
jgi:hypothetical protein